MKQQSFFINMKKITDWLTWRANLDCNITIMKKKKSEFHDWNLSPKSSCGFILNIIDTVNYRDDPPASHELFPPQQSNHHSVIIASFMPSLQTRQRADVLVTVSCCSSDSGCFTNDQTEAGSYITGGGGSLRRPRPLPRFTPRCLCCGRGRDTTPSGDITPTLSGDTSGSCRRLRTRGRPRAKKKTPQPCEANAHT